MHFRRYLSLLIAASVAVFAPHSQGAITYNTVALSGAAGTSLGYGPGVGAGINFSELYGPQLNATGKVVFSGILTGPGIVATANDAGFWSNVGGTLAVVAREGSEGPGPNVGAGVIFQFIQSPVLNDSGHVAFSATLSGTGITSANGTGIWSNTSGSLAPVARVGSTGVAPGPNLGPTIAFQALDYRFGFNASGKIAFEGALGSGTTVTGGGLWTNSFGPMSVLAREGTSGPTPGPNLGSQVQFDAVYLQQSVPNLNAAGDSAFFATLAGTGIDSTNNIGIWRTTSGALGLLARTGSSGPGPNLGAGVQFSALGLGSLDQLSLNAAGNVAFAASLTGAGIDSSNNQGIWKTAGGLVSVVARKGPSGPGPNVGAGVNFESFNDSHTVINGTGNVAFWASLSGTGIDASNDTGIWTDLGGTITAVAREGSSGPSPNVGEGIYFASIPSKGATFAANAAGEIAFAATLAGTGVSSANDGGIWIWNHGALTKIVREGDLFDVNPSPSQADMRTISLINLLGRSGGQDGRPTSLNDDGQLVFKLSFTDGSSGVFTAQLPRLPGDFDNDGDVDGADFVAWQTNFPLASGATLAMGDADRDGDVDGADFVVWQSNFPFTPGPGISAVPEPAAGVLAILAAMTLLVARRGR
jgi:hypothetical protein